MSKSKGLHYWVPIFLPIMIGLLLPLLQLQTGFAETETLRKAADQQRAQLSELVNHLLGQIHTENLKDGVNPQAAANEVNAMFTSLLEDDAEYVSVQDNRIVVNHGLINSALEKLLDSKLQDEYENALFLDLSNFLKNLNSGIAVAVVSVDVWALTTLLTIAAGLGIAGTVYAGPLLALFLHICLVIIIHALSKSESTTYLMIGTAGTILAVLVAWRVREVIWHHIDGPHAGKLVLQAPSEDA